MLSTRFSVESLSSRLSGDKPLPRPTYYFKMNPQEQVIHNIIGEEKFEYIRDRKGRVHKRFLTHAQRAQKQRMFYETRVGHAIVGDEWMRMKLPARRH
ncbi:Nn.00g008620.m01.CDS01 [Neocucurbitaria sp. VM-36]